MFGIGEGISSDQNSQHNKLEQSAGFATGLGTGDLTASSNFMQSILSGDPTKIATALAPEISGQQKQTQQAKNQLAQFSSRSGGTAASAAGMDTAGRSNIINLQGGATSKAASDLGTLGKGLLDTGINATTTGFDQSSQLQKQSSAQLNDIINSGFDVAKMAVGGFGNLDKTGGSTGGEQTLNFLSGMGF